MLERRFRDDGSENVGAEMSLVPKIALGDGRKIAGSLGAVRGANVQERNAGDTGGGNVGAGIR